MPRGRGYGAGATACSKRSGATPQACAAAASHAVVPSAPSGNGAGSQVAPRSVERAGGLGQEGLGQQIARVRPDRRQVGRALRGGRKRTGPTPIASNSRPIWSSTTSASAPTTSCPAGTPVAADRGSSGTSAARHASSPWVNVVSMPLPE